MLLFQNDPGRLIVATPEIDPLGVAMLVTVGLSFLTVSVMLVFKPALMLRVFPGGLQGNARRIFGWLSLIFSISWTTIVILVALCELLRIG
jgi:heme O synthase-like polyprenyltransferase